MIIPYVFASIVGGAVCGAAFFPNGLFVALLAAWSGATGASIVLAVFIATTRAKSEGMARGPAAPRRNRMRRNAHHAAPAHSARAR